ncbi:MAG: hypothetical protein HN377_03975 [Alphaproteobacteria bacterium]|jgi:hypothetical protein|nr:hypothetical protein [Alphaproteobacteria bacterium]MBT7943965.1 hypothetical protein [Alphaproteobacteria bacterium]
MIVKFTTDGLQRKCQSLRLLKKKFGKRIGKAISKKLALLEAFETLADVISFQSIKYQLATENLSPAVIICVESGIEITVLPKGDMLGNPKITISDLGRIREIEILQIGGLDR